MHVGTHLTLPWILRVEGCRTHQQGHGRPSNHYTDLAHESRQHNEAAHPHSNSPISSKIITIMFSSGTPCDESSWYAWHTSACSRPGTETKSSEGYKKIMGQMLRIHQHRGGISLADLMTVVLICIGAGDKHCVCLISLHSVSKQKEQLSFITRLEYLSRPCTVPAPSFSCLTFHLVSS